MRESAAGPITSQGTGTYNARANSIHRQTVVNQPARKNNVGENLNVMGTRTGMGSQLSVTGNMAGISENVRSNQAKTTTKIDIFANDSTPIMAYERNI